MLPRLLALAELQLVDQLLDPVAVLRAKPPARRRRSSPRSRRGYTEDRSQYVVGTDVHIASLLHQPMAAHGVALRVALRQFPDCLPVADIRPADVGGNHRRMSGALHHGVIDRNFWCLAEAFLIERQEAKISLRRCVSRRRRLGDFRLELRQFLLASHRRGRRNCRSSRDSLRYVAPAVARSGFSTNASTLAHARIDGDDFAGADIAISCSRTQSA